MTPADLEAFMACHHLNRRELGLQLGISQDRLRRMLSGAVPIPRSIALACSAIEHDLPPMGEEQ